MNYRIMLRRMTVPLDIGVHDFEKGSVQPVVVSVLLDVSNELLSSKEQHLDYDEIREFIGGLKTEPRFDYQEQLALRIMKHCRGYDHVNGVVVTTSKPDVFEDVEHVGCQLRWGTLEEFSASSDM